MTTLAHVVFYVRDLDRSVEFYTSAVGLELKGRIFHDQAAILTGGSTHHELLLIEVGDAPGSPHGRRIGLYHTGWKVGDSLAELKEAYRRIVDAGYEIDGMSDHTVSQSIYLKDPDGNEIELFVDDPNVDWRNDQSWMKTPVKPLRL